MAKALWFLLKPALVIIGTLTLFYPVLLLLSLLTDGGTFFLTYLQGFFILYDIMLGICAAQAISACVPLALGFGATRRALRGAVLAFWVLLPLLCMVLDFACNSFTARLFSLETNPLLLHLGAFPLQGLGLKFLLCGTLLWMGTVSFGSLPIWKRVLVILVVAVVYLQITVFMFVAILIPATILNVYSAGLGVISLVPTGVTLHRLQKLAITQG